MAARTLSVIMVLAACSSPAERRDREATAARAAVASESARAAAAAALPVTGKWDEPHLVERLVQSGLAPQAATEKSPRYWGVPVHAYRLGSATLHAYLYPDSSARRRATAALDSLSIAPAGSPSPYPLPRLLIVQNNLAAVLVGGNERQQERVSLAITAGLPSPSGR